MQDGNLNVYLLCSPSPESRCKLLPQGANLKHMKATHPGLCRCNATLKREVDGRRSENTEYFIIKLPGGARLFGTGYLQLTREQRPQKRSICFVESVLYVGVLMAVMVAIIGLLMLMMSIRNLTVMWICIVYRGTVRSGITFSYSKALNLNSICDEDEIWYKGSNMAC